MEMCIQLNNIIKSLQHIRNSLNDECVPYLEMIFVGCVATFFSFFKESKGFNKIGQNDDFHKFNVISEDIISDVDLKDAFYKLEKLRDTVYCHKQSAIGYNILGIYFIDDKVKSHTEEKTIPFFIYSDMADFVEQFIRLAEYTLSYVKNKRLKEYENYLNNCLNNKKYKDALMNLIEKNGNDDKKHSDKIQELLKKLSLKDRIDIQGNNLFEDK